MKADFNTSSSLYCVCAICHEERYCPVHVLELGNVCVDCLDKRTMVTVIDDDNIDVQIKGNRKRFTMKDFKEKLGFK